jgi:serine/threonine protein kinase
MLPTSLQGIINLSQDLDKFADSFKLRILGIHMGLATQKNIKDSVLPPQIGRFKPIDILGKGAQGVVYLAEDTQLGRKVAIKTLDRHRQDAEQLNQEAKNVSQLSHPHIIPLYEIGSHAETPFLVYQFCEGEQLKLRMQRDGKLKQYDAVKITSQILDGVGYAHTNKIIHRDLNPSNLLIDNKGDIKIMDFGISVIAGTMTASTEVSGTVNYLAPEQLSNSEFGPSVDIFACGLILYEMLTGHQVYSANNSMAVMYKITNETVAPPSKRNSEVDKDLDAIVMKALEKDPANRYSNSLEMQTALKKYLNIDDENQDASENNNAAGTVEFLLSRMKRKQDFPAISTHITDINQKTSGSTKSSANELANVILKDFALTTKLVRLVNSCFYGQFGGEITTVSRAVVILGYEQVRAAVLSIILFEHLQNKSQAYELKNTAYTALMSGIIAREKAKKMKNISDEDIETAFVTSMFHLLGRLLSIYYFPEEFEAMKTLVANKGIDEDQAIRSLLGASYEELGRGIANEWKLPDIIGDSMRKLPEGVVPVAKTTNDSIRQLACFSNELCAITSGTGDTNQAYEELAARYNDSLGITKESITALLDSSIKEAEEFTSILGIDTSKVTVFNNLRKKVEEKEEAEQSSIEVNNNSPIQDAVSIETTKVEPKTQEQNQHDILVNGIAEITDSLLGETNLNDILTMVLETIYRGMGFNRVLFAIYSPKNKQVLARFGFGKEIDGFIPNFRYNIDDSDDIFVSTVKKGKEFIVLDVNSDEYKNKIPAWLRKLAMPTTVVLYPIIVTKRCLSLIYADNDNTNTKISMEALGFFKSLRNQAALAIQQKRNS